MFNKNFIETVCKSVGAAKVYNASAKAMSGDKSAALIVLGLPAVKNMGEANEIMCVAFELMSNNDKAQDLAGLSISIARHK